jgi:hypothetical protein
MTVGGFFTRDTNNPFWRAVPDHHAIYDLAKAYKAQWHTTTGNVDALKSIKIITPKGELWDADEVIRMTQKKGGLDIGWHADNYEAAARNEIFASGGLTPRMPTVQDVRNIPKAALDQAKSLVMPSQMPKNLMIRAGRMTAEAISNSHRMAMVFKRLRMGDSIDEAVEWSKRFLIDYTDLTPFERQVPRRLFPFYCVPDDCEILTLDGWAKLDDLQCGDTAVAVYDHEANSTHWEMLDRVAVFDYDGQLMTVGDSRNGSFSFTPDHGWPVIDHDGNRKLVKGHELRSNHKIPLVAERHEFPDDTESLLTPREASIVGWILTDGYVRTKGNHVEMLIYQFKPKYVDQLRSLLGDDATEGKPHPVSGQIPFHIVGDLRAHLGRFIQSKADGPHIVTRLSRVAAQAMWDAMHKADGTTSGIEKKSGRFFAATHDKGTGAARFDTFQILTLLLGEVIQRGRHGGYIRHEGKTMKVAGKLGTEPYKGRVWCPELGGKCWYMRRNGRVILTQNSWTRKNLPLQIWGLLNAPQKYARIGHAVRAIQDPQGVVQPYLTNTGVLGGPGEGIDHDQMPTPIDMPRWMRASAGFPLRRRTDTGEIEFMTLTATLPAAEVERMAIPRLGKTFVDLLSPLLKLPLELAGRHSFFFDQSLEGDTEYLGMEMPATMANALQNIRLLSEIDRLNFFNNTPFATRRLRPETEETDQQKLLRFLTGMKIYPTDTRRVRYYAMSRALGRTKRNIRLEEKARRRAVLAREEE